MPARQVICLPAPLDWATSPWVAALSLSDASTATLLWRGRSAAKATNSDELANPRNPQLGFCANNCRWRMHSSAVAMLRSLAVRKAKSLGIGGSGLCQDPRGDAAGDGSRQRRSSHLTHRAAIHSHQAPGAIARSRSRPAADTINTPMASPSAIRRSVGLAGLAAFRPLPRRSGGECALNCQPASCLMPLSVMRPLLTCVCWVLGSCAQQLLSGLSVSHGEAY